MEFQKILIQELQTQKITPYKLAKGTGLSKQSISNYINGKQQPTIDKFILICKYLDVSADYLLGLTDNY